MLAKHTTSEQATEVVAVMKLWVEKKDAYTKDDLDCIVIKCQFKDEVIRLEMLKVLFEDDGISVRAKVWVWDIKRYVPVLQVTLNGFWACDISNLGEVNRKLVVNSEVLFYLLSNGAGPDLIEVLTYFDKCRSQDNSALPIYIEQVPELSAI